MRNKTNSKKDSKMAAAGDKDVVAGVDKLLKTVSKKLPNVVNTNEEYTIQARYHFTELEKKRMANQLAELQIQLAEHEEQKKAAMASFKDRIETVRLQLSQISRGYRDGYELRDHRVSVTYDYKKREKRYLEVGTKKVVDRKPFVPGDEQRKFPGI